MRTFNHVGIVTTESKEGAVYEITAAEDIYTLGGL